MPIFIAYSLFLTSIVGFRVVEPYKNLWVEGNDEVLDLTEYSTAKIAQMNATRPKRESEEKVPGTCTIQDVPFVNYLPKEWDKGKISIKIVN